VLRDALSELTRARQLLLQLMVEDQIAYETLTAARKLPESHPTRQSEFDAALVASIRVPQAMAAAALAILELADRLVDKINHYLLSDLAVCCELAMATLRCAIYNVKANLPDVTDEGDRRTIESTNKRLLDQGTILVQRAVSHIWAAHARSPQTPS
jgi:formiminotetrahydrofolate cyclodeaminase